MGLPNPSSTRPSSPGPTSTRASSLRATIRLPNSSPLVSSNGIESTWPSRNPITWARILRPSALWISQKSPTATAGPLDSTSRPVIASTVPVQR